ncbi:hypothetical protein S7711_09264 [Stachybotrys chartarum IBT 7711]|uniref:Heterokaryon incompatibility domain-containing protein n=1 Tax=Stachybotrys chartarum (strain CBS 109288 / IBT 7711) TaxID=1280523 RepID=A0A084ALQ9_STACB|nr:hypothetical protein S7711_09264 [Stachybotrys chartarum IBT 7711]
MRGLEWLYRRGYTFAGNLGRYIYGPLRWPDSVRLINLLPGDPGSRVQCELFTTRLRRAPPYRALSYCWGGISYTQSISCNGQEFEITANLHDALRRLRQPHEPRTLFVDAICINQRDYAERNQQLLLMRHIYQAAERVAVWLGRDTETIGLVISMLSKLGEIGRKKMDHGVRPGLTTANLQALGLPKHPSPDWSALRYFFRRAWFQRAWVIQEAVNAADLEVLCGDHSLSWEDIVDAARCITDSTMYATTDTAHICQHICFINQCRRTFDRSGSADLQQLSLLYLLNGSRRCDATDLRDKIYGLYPLIASKHELPAPDYAKPVDAIYRETAAHIIRQTGKLDVLGFAGAARHPRTRHLNLPSWVPDWHMQDRARPLVGMFSSQAIQADVRFSSNLDSITIKGVILDEVVSMSDTIQPFQGSIDGSWVDRMLRDWPNGRERLEPTGEEVDIAHIGLHSPSTHDHGSVPTPTPLPSSLDAGYGNTMRDNTVKIVYARRVFRSSRGYLGSVSSYATIGDRIVLFRGAGVPFVVRPTDSGAYKLVGECFLSEFMGDNYSTGAEADCEIRLV